MTQVDKSDSVSEITLTVAVGLCLHCYGYFPIADTHVV